MSSITSCDGKQGRGLEGWNARCHKRKQVLPGREDPLMASPIFEFSPLEEVLLQSSLVWATSEPPPNGGSKESKGYRASGVLHVVTDGWGVHQGFSPKVSALSIVSLHSLMPPMVREGIERPIETPFAQY